MSCLIGLKAPEWAEVRIKYLENRVKESEELTRVYRDLSLELRGMKEPEPSED